jgi:hypothetical protein
MGETYLPFIAEKIHRIANLVSHVIDSKDIFYISGSPNAQEVYERIYAENSTKETYWISKISIIAVHFFQYATQQRYHRYFNHVNYEIKEKTKDFLSFNKMPREHRVRLLENMLATDYISKGYMSFEGDPHWIANIENINNEFTHVKQNKNLLPIRLNISDERFYPVDITDDDLKYFDDSYYSIVTETCFYTSEMTLEGCIFISEKTYKCLSMKHPFILLTRPHTMAELRKMGYKTFSPMIDESYDSIVDDTERFNAIWAEITRLSNQTTEEWIEWQSKIKEIVDYNHTHFYENVNHT